MKLALQNAILILLAGLLLILCGVVLNRAQTKLANLTILSGLVVEFIGTIWLVLSLNQRRKKNL